jgi:hypothetical protein
LLRTPPGNRTSLRVSPPTSSLFWHTRVDRILRMDRQTPLMLSTWRPTETREWVRRIHGIFSNGKPAVVNSSCTSATSEERASTAPGEPLNQSCKRPLRSAALHRSGKPSKSLCLERLVGGRIVRAQSLWWQKTRAQRFQRTGVLNDRSLAVNSESVHEEPSTSSGSFAAAAGYGMLALWGHSKRLVSSKALVSRRNGNDRPCHPDRRSNRAISRCRGLVGGTRCCILSMVEVPPRRPLTCAHR